MATITISEDLVNTVAYDGDIVLLPLIGSINFNEVFIKVSGSVTLRPTAPNKIGGVSGDTVVTDNVLLKTTGSNGWYNAASTLTSSDESITVTKTANGFDITTEGGGFDPTATYEITGAMNFNSGSLKLSTDPGVSGYSLTYTQPDNLYNIIVPAASSHMTLVASGITTPTAISIYTTSTLDISSDDTMTIYGEQAVSITANTNNLSLESGANIALTATGNTNLTGSEIRVDGLLTLVDTSLSGVATLVAGAATIANSLVDANSIIQVTYSGNPTTPGHLYITSIVNNTSFDIMSTEATAGDVFWTLVKKEP